MRRARRLMVAGYRSCIGPTVEATPRAHIILAQVGEERPRVAFATTGLRKDSLAAPGGVRKPALHQVGTGNRNIRLRHHVTHPKQRPPVPSTGADLRFGTKLRTPKPPILRCQEDP